MTLTEAKRVFRQYTANKLGHDDAGQVHEAIEAVTASWRSKVRKPGGGRRKGHDYEREVSSYLRAIWPDAKRGLQSRGGGAEVADTEGTPLYVECKRKHRLTNVLGTWYRAAEESDGRPAVVVAKEDGKPAVAVVPLELLLGLLRYVSVDVADPDMPRVCEVGREIMEGER
jgi:hypothetical protein